MTFEKYQNLMKFASKLNIKTASDLLAFKKQSNVKTNHELYMALYFAALRVVKNVS